MPPDHIVFTIEKVVNELGECFTDFCFTFGRPSYHPKLLLSALLNAYTQEVLSGRKIEKLMIENMDMQYLTGQLVVSYRTINHFREGKEMENLIRELFIELNLHLKMADLVTLDCLYIDGTKIEVNANKYSFVWKEVDDKFSAKLQDNLHRHDLKMVVADAGYGSEENLTRLDQLGLVQLIKYSMFDKEQKRKQKQSTKNLDNWFYDEVSDTYTHPDGWGYHFDYIKHTRTSTGFQQEIRVYRAE